MKKIFILSVSLILLCVVVLQLDFQRFAKRPGCAFCNEEVLERQIFYRGNKALGILTHKPAVLGHVLIIPERHVERFEDLSHEEMAALGEAIKKVDLAVRKAFGTGDYVLIQKNGKEAGQTVPHVHFHYLPASNFLAAKYLLSPWLKALDQTELTRLREALSEAILESGATDASLPSHFSSKNEPVQDPKATAF